MLDIFKPASAKEIAQRQANGKVGIPPGTWTYISIPQNAVWTENFTASALEGLARELRDEIDRRILGIFLGKDIA